MPFFLFPFAVACKYLYDRFSFICDTQPLNTSIILYHFYPLNHFWTRTNHYSTQWRTLPWVEISWLDF